MAVSTVPRAEQLELSLLQMHRIRAFEAKAMELFQEKLIRGSVHPYTGMEAIAVGVCSALGEQDYITSTHRGHGHSIAKGLDLKLMMAEITGRATGYCGGRWSMHITALATACSAPTRSLPGRSRSQPARRTPCPAGEGRRGRLVLRRRRVESGHLPRGGEPGLGPRRAGDLRLREQPMGDSPPFQGAVTCRTSPSRRRITASGEVR